MNTFSEKDATRILDSHGYRIEGDTAFLNADLFVPLQAQKTHWALQLWACERPHQGGQVAGFKIAEAAVELPREPGGVPHHVEAQAFARLPADRREYSMVLVVAPAGGGSEQVHDFANYPQRQTFIAPHLDGAVTYAVEADQVTLKAERVHNPRLRSNLSGTLSLELRAMSEPYRGDDTESTVLATALLGRIAGQDSLQSFEAKAPFAAPPVGLWHMVLLLREWTADAGYVTRDSCNFSVPFETRGSAAAPVAAEPEPTLAVPSAEIALAAPTGVAPKSRGLSIQTATVDELAKVKGLTRKIALEIVKHRPFTSLDDLLQIRGIGEKSLRKLRALLTL